MKRTILPWLMSLGIVCLAGCGEPNNTLTEAESASGWKLLFDGESLDGWRGYMGSNIDVAWRAEDGMMVLEGGSPKGSYVNIISEGQYDDFDLRFEWKVEEGANSGVMFHVQEGPKMPHLTGPEYQILDNDGFRGGDGKPVTEKEYTGSHYAIEPPLVDAVNPVGEWNSSRILVEGNSVQYWLNGELTAEYEMHSPKWKAQVAQAKFGRWEHFATADRGHFALQDHGHGVRFRNVKVKAD